ncbi:hypothetical protein [uncultured Algoriphagus sp.]|uniref:hypothetical protein n=1 Tax=uncultured Algoriphagus sp. TaxID=417365 RepID=UPI0030ED2D29|tara:strand:+ start:1173 stop:1595 length:423 start_codon:yes stop_codon:yes gene_type:complete
MVKLESKKYPVESEMKDGKPVENYLKKHAPNQGEVGPIIKSARYDSLELFEVSESELTIIERGSPSSTYLNFAIFLVSIAISFLTTLLTVDLKDNIVLFTVYLVICVIGFMVGIFLTILWIRSKNEFSDVIKKIRGRMEG